MPCGGVNHKISHEIIISLLVEGVPLIMNLCRLCRKKRELRDSHIIPEFCYKPLYDPKHRMAKLNIESRNKKLLQKGIREKLLCADCEQHLNKEYETPFCNFWFKKSTLPKKLPYEPFIISGIDHQKFKLFHLSLLFRAGVSTLKEFEEVSLGPHEEKLRLMLLSNQLETSSFYNIGAVHIGNNDKNKNHLMIISPCKTRFFEYTSYMFTFGGCAWNYILSSHSQERTLDIMLNKDGTLPLISIDWRIIVNHSKACDRS